MREKARLEAPIATQSPHPLRIATEPLVRHYRPVPARILRLSRWRHALGDVRRRLCLPPGRRLPPTLLPRSLRVQRRTRWPGASTQQRTGVQRRGESQSAHSAGARDLGSATNGLWIAESGTASGWLRPSSPTVHTRFGSDRNAQNSLDHDNSESARGQHPLNLMEIYALVPDGLSRS